MYSSPDHGGPHSLPDDNEYKEIRINSNETLQIDLLQLDDEAHGEFMLTIL